MVPGARSPPGFAVSSPHLQRQSTGTEVPPGSTWGPWQDPGCRSPTGTAQSPAGQEQIHPALTQGGGTIPVPRSAGMDPAAPQRAVSPPWTPPPPGTLLQSQLRAILAPRLSQSRERGSPSGTGISHRDRPPAGFCDATRPSVRTPFYPSTCHRWGSSTHGRKEKARQSAAGSLPRFPPAPQHQSPRGAAAHRLSPVSKERPGGPGDGRHGRRQAGASGGVIRK